MLRLVARARFRHWRLLFAGLLLTACSTDQSAPWAPAPPPVGRYVATLKPFAKGPYNRQVAFYLDLTRPSGQPRFFVLDLRRKRILAQGLCCSGRTDVLGQVIYSNVAESHCSSRGLARVDYRYTGTFGRAYKLRGLQPSNSRIFERNIVLHGHGCVPAEPQTAPICRSQGCPTVNPAFLRVLSRYIDGSRRPLLLYIQ